MNDFFDKLNLRPMERRLVIIAGLVIFVVLNFVFIRPRFGDYKKVKANFAAARETLKRYQDEIEEAKDYKAALTELERDEQLMPEEIAVQLARKIQDQAQMSGIMPQGIQPVSKSGGTARTDQFFDEHSVLMRFQNASDEELIDFLYNLSAGKSMIRVRSLNVRPDPGMQKLQGDITLTASYQKKAPSRLASTGLSKPPASGASRTNATPRSTSSATNSKAAPKSGSKPPEAKARPAPTPAKSTPPKPAPAPKPKPDSASVEP